MSATLSEVRCLGCGNPGSYDLAHATTTTPEGYRQQRIVDAPNGCGTRMRRFIASDGTPRAWEINRSPPDPPEAPK